VRERRRVDVVRLGQGHRAALGAAADRPGDVQARRGFGPAGGGEALARRGGRRDTAGAPGGRAAPARPPGRTKLFSGSSSSLTRSQSSSSHSTCPGATRRGPPPALHGARGRGTEANTAV